MKRPSPYLLLALLLVICFCLATTLQPRRAVWADREDSGNVMKLLFGEGQQIFAEQMTRHADVSFHSGYYPSFFDQAKPKESEMAKRQEHHHHEGGHEEEGMDFLGEPHDWIEKFGRHFRVTDHTHLSAGQEREIMPWLRLSADLDPHHIDTYTVAAYWLRNSLGKVKEAEQFLREGLRNNPDSYQILFELGRVYNENQHYTMRARNVWDLALRRWTSSQAGKKDPDLLTLEQIALNLAHLEEAEGNYERAVEMLQLAKKASPHPENLDPQISELQEKSRPPKPKY